MEKNMVVRKAKPEDSHAIAVLLLSAMEELVYKFIGTQSYNEAVAFLFRFVEQRNTQYSWENCFVCEIEGMAVGAINAYDGADLVRLRQPVIDYARTQLLKEFNPEDETGPGEYYIDSIGVSPEFRGCGAGSELLRFVIAKCAVGGLTPGLLVDKDNPAAKKLYERLGFSLVGEKTLAGKPMFHLQLKQN